MKSISKSYVNVCNVVGTKIALPSLSSVGSAKYAHTQTSIKNETSGYATWFTAGGVIRIGNYKREKNGGHFAP